MVSPKILAARGFTPEKLKAKFTKAKGAYDKPTQKLLDLIQSRIITGRTQNLMNYRTFLALDAVYNAPYCQQSIALTQQFMTQAQGQTYEQACNLCDSWGLNKENLFYQETDGQGKAVLKDGKPVMRINAQNMFSVLIPICKSYLTMRLAKLYNDRALYPFMKYSPISFTAEKRAMCEVVTDLVQRICTDFGYPAYFRQVLLQTLLYGFCLVFPKEPWYKEEQLTDAQTYKVQAGDTLRKIQDKFDVTAAQLNKANKGRKGKLQVGETITIPERKTCVKQGLRYDTPHPTRCFFDLSEPTNTMNTDTGVAFAGYWRVMKYGDVMNNSRYWNKDDISFGTTDWFNFQGAKAFWMEVYPCSMRFPGDAYVGPGANASMQRDRRLIYNSTDADMPVFVTSLVMKIVPSEYGLADYDYPVWVRFLVANDNAVIWCDLYPYNPTLYCCYDADNNRWPNASLALEILPFQVHLGNLISQILFTAKQALYKVVPFDTNQINRETIQTLQQRGENAYGGLVFLPYDSLKSKLASQVGPAQMFQPINLGAGNSAEMTAQIPILISLCERLIGMSAQEVGATATHEQSAEETRVIANNSTVRVDYTGSFVDDFFDAWKRQLYDASQCFMDDEFISQVLPTPETLAALAKMGFDVPTNSPTSSYGSDKITIKVSKAKLTLDGFSSNRDGANRINDAQVAAVVLQGVQTITQNPLLLQYVGPEAILEILTQGLILAGAPKDFRLRVDARATPEVQAQQMQEQLGAVSQDILKQVGEGIKPLAEAIKQGQEQTQQVAEAQQQLVQAVPQLIQKLQELEQGLQQNGQMDQKIGQALVQTKQEADATAQAVVDMKQMLTQLMQMLPQGPQPAMAPMMG